MPASTRAATLKRPYTAFWRKVRICSPSAGSMRMENAFAAIKALKVEVNHTPGIALARLPILAHWQKEATETRSGVDDFLRRFPKANWAGFLPESLILDVDPRNNGLTELERLKADLLKMHPMGLGETRTHTTGSGGLHLIYKLNEGLELTASKLKGYQGIDVKIGTKGYVVIPPSIHLLGEYSVQRYLPVTSAHPCLIDLIQKGKGISLSPSNVKPGESIPKGQQDNWLTSRAGGYHRLGDTEDQIREKLRIDALRLIKTLRTLTLMLTLNE